MNDFEANGLMFWTRIPNLNEHYTHSSPKKRKLFDIGRKWVCKEEYKCREKKKRAQNRIDNLQSDFFFNVKITSRNSLKKTIDRHVPERSRRSSYHFTMQIVVFLILNWGEVINVTMKSHLYETNCQTFLCSIFRYHFDSRILYVYTCICKCECMAALITYRTDFYIHHLNERNLIKIIRIIIFFLSSLFSFRFIEEEPIHKPELLLIVGCIGLLVNLVGLVLLYGKFGWMTLTNKPRYFDLKFFELIILRTWWTSWTFTWDCSIK